MNFNINQKVRVKLTEFGKQKHKQMHEEFWLGTLQPDRPYVPPVEDAEGWSEWQLHALMYELGHLCYLGGPVPFETEIQMEPFDG